jgi:methyl-accepting chemotaxis protein
MDLLRNLFGSLTSGIIRLAVTVGILVAVYLLIVKPVLHTTSEVTDKAFKASGIDEISKTIDSVNRQVQRQIRHSFHTAQKAGGNPQKLVHCIQRANQNVDRIQHCTRRF